MSKAETFTIEPRTVWPRFLLPALQSLPIPGPGSYRVHRLRWAGQMADLAPEEVARRVGATAWAAPGEKRKSIASILAAIGRGSPPMHLERSDSITYWLAVNKRALAELSITRGLHDLESLPAVAGLAASDASWVVEQLLALDDRAIRVEQHVSWFAHSQWDNELYREFDTAVRDGLASIAVQCVRSYFAFLSDYLWTAEGGFADADTKLRWSGQATYLFWVGRVAARRGRRWDGEDLRRRQPQIRRWPTRGSIEP